MTAKTKPTILIVVGITGDLSHRKLLPAIEQIVKAQAAPEKFEVVGISRRDVTAAEVLKGSMAEVQKGFLSKHLNMFQMDLSNPADYNRLKDYLKELEVQMGAPAQRLFYLSVPPQISEPIIRCLGEVGLAESSDTKLLLEKPFGTDLTSAQELITQTRKYFKEEQIYRIDHYLAKDMAQNLVVFRGGNSLFKRTWNKDFIERIQVVASEAIDIEGRTTFYEQTGALRDVVQSHLLQLAALTLMQSPEVGQVSEVPKHRLAALKQLQLPAGQPITNSVKRAQYKGYQRDVNNPDSRTETFVSLTLESQDPAWAGVPIQLITGKSLKEKLTEIRITYKKEQQFEANELVIKFQPHEEIELCLWIKVPGYEWRVERHFLQLEFNEQFGEIREAYEQVLLDAIVGNHTFFTSSEEVLETWRILQPILSAWSMQDQDLQLYPPGTDYQELM
ncbi:MAG: zwf, glucose-6-phosphate 1-dehydrogenase [Candidatus Saccharibacteria bacterium]|nr:zwf, glucose-6-phosphate 1-dehydrogenase [Candidatus Saccharibacteria bacterium]